MVGVAHWQYDQIPSHPGGPTVKNHCIADVFHTGESSEPCARLPSPGVQHREEAPPEHLALKGRGAWLQEPLRTGQTETPCWEGKSSDSLLVSEGFLERWGQGWWGPLSRVLHELWLEADIPGPWYQDLAPPTAWKLQCWNAQTPQNHLDKKTEGFPGGPMVNHPPANAKDTGSNPRSGKTPHAKRH